MGSLALAAVIMFVVMTVTFRSLRLGLISVTPNTLPLAATASLLVALDIPMAGATAFVMSLGIAVDDTIHFLTRFNREHKREPDVEIAVRRSLLGVGKALVTTTVVLVAGFASVITSDFPRNRGLCRHDLHHSDYRSHLRPGALACHAALLRAD